jgi:hypothetical protein
MWSVANAAKTVPCAGSNFRVAVIKPCTPTLYRSSRSKVGGKKSFIRSTTILTNPKFLSIIP